MGLSIPRLFTSLGKVARRAAMFSDAICEIILSGFSAQMKVDRRMRDNEHGAHLVMHDGNDEVNDYLKSRSLTSATSQRGSMPGEEIGCQEASAVTSTPQRGTRLGGKAEAHSRQ